MMNIDIVPLPHSESAAPPPGIKNNPFFFKHGWSDVEWRRDQREALSLAGLSSASGRSDLFITQGPHMLRQWFEICLQNFIFFG